MRWRTSISFYLHLSDGFLSPLSDFSGRSLRKPWIMVVFGKKLIAQRSWWVYKREIGIGDDEDDGRKD